MRILIAEDDFTSRIVLAEVLKKNGHEVVVTANGDEAWQALQQPDAPRLAILDWMMPGISGVDVCSRVRKLPTDQPPYIIMLTSKGDKEDIVTGLESGADDYLSKPFVLEELRARVDVGRRMLDLQAAMANKVQELTHWQNQMVRELKVAALLQTKLLSTTPLLTPRHEVRMLYRPCQLIGGDFFDALDLPDGRLCVYVGDVVGHGVAPAMIAALMKSVVSDVVRGMPDCSPAALCREINSRFRGQVPDPDIFATLFIAFHDADAREWRAMNCGHPPPILISRNGENLSPALARTGSLPVGIEPNPGSGTAYDERDEVSAPANPGDLLFLCSDGLLDARHNERGTPCGAEGLFTVVSGSFDDAATCDYPARVLDLIADLGFNLNRDDCCAVSVRLPLPDELILDLFLDPSSEPPADAKAPVERALRANNWPAASAGLVCRLAQNYVVSVVEHDRVPAGRLVRMQVRLSGKSCRLLFFSEGRERDRASRLADLQARWLEAPAAADRPQATFDAVARRCDLFRRGQQNVACFVIDP